MPIDLNFYLLSLLAVSMGNNNEMIEIYVQKICVKNVVILG